MSDQEHRKVLLVEDNPGDARLILELLKDSGEDCFDIEAVDSLTGALRHLKAGGIEAVLLDLALPDSQGQKTFDKVREQDPTVPIVVLTGAGDEVLGLKLVRMGAQDYVAKTELSGSILARAIRYAIERGATEQQIRRFNQELESVVKKRTAELEAANEELEAFSYSVAHDLRAPLRHIDGYCRILLETLGNRLDAEAQNCLDRILRAVKSMAGTIDELLKLARLGRQKLDRRTTNLNSIVDRALQSLSPETVGREISWNVATLSTVECDPGLMNQVFVNLLGNSVKYTRARAPATIEVGQIRIDHQLVTFVRDNGAGFSMESADKLFTAFQRFHRQDEFEGTGVGLATVRRIIQRHGGRIWAESAPDQGATFYFTLGVSD
jgi:signal transduction histidine kinase